MKQTLSCIIIEDEPLALERTRQFVGRVPFLDLRATFDDALAGLDYLQAHPVEVLFLDIRMDELSGVELLESSSFGGEVILTTAYAEYALKGYELAVTDYLLKPFTFPRFLQAVGKARARLAARAPVPAADFIFVKTENRLDRVFLADILYIEGMRDYRCLHTTDRRIMTLQSFQELERQIPATVICRVHRSYMVNLARIESVERSRIWIGDVVIPVSDTYREAFFRYIRSDG